jgi:Tol biopolymer transport system component
MVALRSTWLLGLAGFVVLCPSPAFAQGRVEKLNDPLYRPVLGNVHEARFSADGAWIVYRADQDVDEQIDLYGVPASGSRPAIRLNRPEDGHVTRFALSRDNLVVYHAGQNLFSVPLDRSREPLHIDSAAARAGDARYFVLTPDLARVAYLADSDGDGAPELLLGAVDGLTPPRRLSGALLGPGLPVFSPDGARVVFLARTLAGWELFGAPVDVLPGAPPGGAQPVKLNGPLVAGAGYYGFTFAFSPDGTRVVYSSDERQKDRQELFVVASDGSGPPLVLHGTPVDSRDVSFFQIDPLGQRVLYTADHDRAATYELYSVPLDGSLAPKKLHAALNGERDVREFRFLPDGSTVVFSGELDSEGLYELYAVPLDGSKAPRKLNTLPLTIPDFEFVPEVGRVVYRGDYPQGGSERLYGVDLYDTLDTLVYSEAGGPINEFQFTPDGQSVLFRRFTGRPDCLLYLAPLDASSPARLLFTGNVYKERIDSRGKRLLFLAADLSDVSELYGLALTQGSVPVKLNGPLPIGSAIGDVRDFVVDSDRVVYRTGIFGCCDSETDELHVVPLDRSAAPLKLLPSAGLGIGYEDDVRGYQVAQQDERLVFRLGAEEGEGFHLYSTFLAGGPPLLLSVREQSTFGATQFALLPGGARAVFLQDFNDLRRLFHVQTDGSTPPSELSGAMVPGGEVARFWLTSDGSQAVYVADQVKDGDFELFRVPTDGSAPPLQLTDGPAPVTSPYYRTYQLVLTADGTRALYRIDQDAQEVFELYSVPLDGSTSPVKLNATLPAGGDVRESIQLAAGRVVYLADQQADEVVELYSVPLDGSGPPVKLNGSLVAGGDVQSSVSFAAVNFLVSPDGSRVLYRADQERDDVVELYSVASDGSSAPVRVNAAFPANADVQSFRFSPDSRRVVYVADAVVDESFELFSAPLDGSAAPVRLMPALPAGGDVFQVFGDWQFQICADSSAVVYLADQAVDERVELFRVPIAGGRAPVRLSAGLTAGGDVTSFRFAPDGRHVLYIADQDEDQVFELYRTALERGPRSASKR